ncbi:hypothetical protein HY485_00175 [Candidatus Woesearchaeota archaeon]|nr:hypothetical protein [Candidatus Woesearchaeota archaeon]
MPKYVLAIYSFVIIVALAGIFTTQYLDDTTITGNVARQKTQGVLVGKTQQIQSYTPQAKKATSSLTIKEGMPYKIMTGEMGLGTTMAGMVNIGGIPVSTTTLQDKCIIFGNDGRLHTPNGKQVQIRDSELRRKPIKLTFGEKKAC